VVATSSLPIDLAAQVQARFPAARVDVPGEWIGLARTDLADAEALVCLLLDPIDAVLLARAPKLRVVATCAVGYDNIDVAACTARGIAVCNTPDVLTEATAELAFALLLAAARRLPEGEALVRGGGWTGWRLDQLLGMELTGKTLGIIGLGRIGKAMARRAEAFGMNIVYASHREGDPVGVAPHGDRHPGPPRTRLSIDEVFAAADVISLHCPLTPETRHVVDARRLGLMRPGGIVVNTARGACVDDGALADALTSGRLFAAALDVFTGEPALDPRLLAAPRLVLAPHIGSATTDTRTRMAQLCADAVIAVLAGESPRHQVNRG
jgi:glyoxylate reductase